MPLRYLRMARNSGINTVSKYVAPRECEYRTESICPGTSAVVRFAKSEQKPNCEKASGIKIRVLLYDSVQFIE